MAFRILFQECTSNAPPSYRDDPGLSYSSLWRSPSLHAFPVCTGMALLVNISPFIHLRIYQLVFLQSPLCAERNTDK